MYLLTLLSLLFYLSSALSTTSPPSSITLAYAPLSPPTAKPPTPKPFATLSYHSTNKTYTLSSFTTPKLPANQPPNTLIRIGIIPHSKSQLQTDGFAAPSVTVAEQNVLVAPHAAVVRIVLDAEFAVISAGVSRDGSGEGSWGDGKKVDGVVVPRLEVVYSAPEPRPVLNRPVVLGEDGKLPAQEKPEPTLFQRYWWIGAIVLLFTLVGGGGEEGGK